jgi:hypothetical protein
VILAKRAIVGRVFIARLTTPNIVSVQTIQINNRSLILLRLLKGRRGKKSDVLVNLVLNHFISVSICFLCEIQQNDWY